MLIKICGITTPEIATACFEAGADMIGLVHYPPSPRHVDEARIREILDAVEPFRKSGRRIVLVVVGQLPNEFDSRIDLIQSNGTERRDIPFHQICVVKDRDTFDRLLQSSTESESPVLYALEMSSGILPGGNGTVWDWSLARPFCTRYPTLLAGGITPKNAIEAIELAKPHGIDVSSGVESAPGIKDLDKIRRLIETIRCSTTLHDRKHETHLS